MTSTDSSASEDAFVFEDAVAFGDAVAERTRQVSAQRDALRAAIEATRDARSLDFADDEHDPDGSLASLDQARDTALLARAEQTLAELAAARERLASGRYGICAGCGEMIGPARLEARPETELCLDCARRDRR